MTDGDSIDALAAQWAAERPDLDHETMATVARLMRVGALLRGRVGELARSEGLQVGEGDVLLTLRRAGAPYRLSPSRLARSTLVATGTMTNRLDRLERRGLVRRIPHPSDRRGLEVELTPEGFELVDSMVGKHVANEQELLSPLSARERDALVRSTRKLLAHLEESAIT
ncbi:MAG: MarR family transcriptional regulator [Thermoleophilaceae bacterium]|nr:MarR family transcriptional regulator [Thermoleophilaceae bacterium]